MKYTYTHYIGELKGDEFEYFERTNPGYTCTGETLIEEYREERGRDGGGCTYVVFKCKPGHHGTRYGMCRDCGDHYIIARWSRYDRIDKKTLEITFDVEDR